MEDIKPRGNTNTCPKVVDEDDDPPMLSPHALAALQEFLKEQNQQHEPTDQIRSSAQNDGDDDAASVEVALVSEDWRLSQFWYDRETAETVANEVGVLCADMSDSKVACIACPTLYAYLKKIHPNISAQLLEYDKRFVQYGSDFTFYDYNQPEDLPEALKHEYNIIVADPPYLSQECLEKVAETISYIACSKNIHLLLLTGAVQKDRASGLLGLHPCVFRPRHTSKLGNEFCLFTNYDPGQRLGGWEPEK